MTGGRERPGPPKVVVVGGGLAGTAAALACADGGAAVTLVEARPRLGGATFSFRREGLSVDNGQHVFLRCCTAYVGFLRRIGAEGLATMQDRLAIPVIRPGGPVGWLRRSALPAPLHLGRALASYPFLDRASRWRVVRAALALGRLDPSDPALDQRTFGSWLEEHRQSPDAVEALWNLIALPTLNLSAGDASLALAVKVFRTGLLTSADGADLGYARAPLGVIHGERGAAALAAAGAEVRLAAPIRSIEAEATLGPDSRFAVGLEGASDPLEADALVVAVPHDRAAALLPAGSLEDPSALAGLGASPIVNVHVVYDRPVMDLPFAAGLGTPVQWVFDRTESSGLDRGQYLAVSVSGADGEIGERTEDLRARFLPALEAMFPRAAGARVESFFVTREQSATFRQAPGTARLRPPARTGVAGVSLAGAWTATGWPATMEGAVRSGLAAARQALVHVGRTRAMPEVVAA
jgi:squalene-associated FAD-dependent desaturase